MAVTISERFAEVRARVEEAARRGGRDPETVTILPVSKTFGVDVLKEAVDAGIVTFGENRAQELKEKATVLPEATWHFVGHLQTNKVKHVVGIASLIHSIDRFGVAEAVARRARAQGVVQEVLIEVNVSGEAAKHGVEPPKVPDLAARVADLDGLSLRGLMTMPPLPEKPEDSRPYFADLNALARRLALPELSMGMTRDFEVAVEEGATIVRIGEAIFGPRRNKA